MGKVFTLLERHWYSALFLVLLGGAVAMLFSRADKQPESNSLQRGLLELSGPFQKGMTKSVGFFEGLWERYVYLVELEEENRKLKQIVADLSLDKAMLQEVIGKRLRRSPSCVPLLPSCKRAFA